MCDSCICPDINCAVRGYAPIKWCCKNCELLIKGTCEKAKDKDETLDDSSLIAHIFDDLEKKISKDIRTFKEAILSRSRY